ncbi:TPA: hypothetical protein EYP13_00890, partial [Candidatus Micrarchaeota archaeon]|nr:hypothetical protein [Candidatus Micrarchaeota archaeon]
MAPHLPQWGPRTPALFRATPPVSCICMIDGIQVATGCTPGKGNLRVRN